MSLFERIKSLVVNLPAKEKCLLCDGDVNPNDKKVSIVRYHVDGSDLQSSYICESCSEDFDDVAIEDETITL